MQEKLIELISMVKHHPDFPKAGMLLSHNGVVRESSRDGRRVTGLRVAVDNALLADVLKEKRQLPGIVDIQVWIDDTRDLAIGEDVMFIVVAGDVRERVIAALSDTLNTIKAHVTRKTEFFAD